MNADADALRNTSATHSPRVHGRRLQLRSLKKNMIKPLLSDPGGLWGPSPTPGRAPPPHISSNKFSGKKETCQMALKLEAGL